MHGHDVIDRCSKPVIGDGCSVISMAANAVGGTAESVDARITAAAEASADATGLGLVVAVQFSNPAGGNPIWLRDAVRGAATASAGLRIAAGENSEIYGWQQGNGFLLETDHTVYLLLFRS